MKAISKHKNVKFYSMIEDLQMYYVNVLQDLMSGLVGPLIVCRKDTLNTERRRKDTDKEFALLFMVFDENLSHYLDENIKTKLKADPDEFDKYNESFMESNKMHGKCVCVCVYHKREIHGMFSFF